MHAEPHEDGGQGKTTPSTQSAARAAQDGNRRTCRGDQDSSQQPDKISAAAYPAAEIRPRTAAQRRHLPRRPDRRASRGTHQAESTEEAAHATTAAISASRSGRQPEAVPPATPRREGSQSGDHFHATEAARQSEQKPAPHTNLKARQPHRGTRSAPRQYLPEAEAAAANISAPARTTCRGSSTATAGNLPAATAGNPEALYNKNNDISIL